MVNTQYAQGRRAEYNVRDFFRTEGYRAWRTAGSHGPFDVIALDKSEVILAQVKSFTDNPGDYSEDIKKLSKLPAPPYVSKLMVLFKVGKGIVSIERVD